MSYSNMVADDNMERDDKRLRFDKEQAENSAAKIKIHLMKKNRNHLGLGPQPHQKVEEWRERNDTCVATIWEACEHDPDVREVADQYLKSKELLPIGDPNKEVLSKELLDTLVARFRGELGNVLEDTTAAYHAFVIKPNEKVSVGVDRLNGIIQKLVQLGQGPTPASKLAKIKAAIQTEELKELFLSVAMLPKATTTFETIKDACEEFESAKEKLKKKLVTADGEELHFTKEKSTKKVVCSHCKKIGHSANKCFDKIKLQKLAQLKRAGKSAAKQGTGNGPQQPGSAAYTGCRKCGDMDHKAADCPKKKSDKKRKKHEYETYVDDSD